MSQKSSNKQCCSTLILSNMKPSQILPFLYVGCQEDALSTKTLQDNHITHVINVSTTGEKAAFLRENDEEHFLRIPVNDCHNAKLLPYFDIAYAFIEKARINRGHVLIHCLAGISRSPTFAIAYIMRYLHLSADDAYKYVKQRRSQISPNFNFLGQLNEYEHNLSLSSSSTDIPISKCVKIETPLNEHRRFVQVESSSNNHIDDSIKYQTNVLSRPTCLNFDLNKKSQLSSIEIPQQDSLVTKKSLRPNSISINQPVSKVKCSTFELINTNCEVVPKSADISSRTDQNDLINTYFQDSTVLSQPCKSVQSTIDSANETTSSSGTNVEVLVL